MKKNTKNVLTDDILTDSYSIIETGGKQYFAFSGKTLAIEKIEGDPGKEIFFKNVLLRRINAQKCEIGKPYLSTPVKATIVKQIRGPKVIVFKFKRRKKYRRKLSHRQPYTVVRIEK